MNLEGIFWTSEENDGKWTVKCSNSNETSSFHDNQQDAWREARRLARGNGSNAYLKDKNGEICTSNSYCTDQFLSK